MQQNFQFPTDHELQELERFLKSEAVPATAMNVSMLEGFLTAIVIGPQVVVPSRWLPWVWDAENGQEELEFASHQQAEWAIGIVMGLMNRIADQFANSPALFKPIFLRGGEWDAADWCAGFLRATTQFDAEVWTLMWTADGLKSVQDKRPSLISPFMRLADATGAAITAEEGSEQKWIAAVQPSLLGIHAYWQERRKPALEQMANIGALLSGRTIQRDGPKVGRNDPCPCGSGKKFKKCCGAAPTIH